MHFDGKLLPNQEGMKNDRLAIVVSGLGVGHPYLACRKCAVDGQEGDGVYPRWSGVEENLAGLCFDKTASNTGVHTGVITVIQGFFTRRLVPCVQASHVGAVRSSSI